jgi:chaperone required for assembly of F1-ATPase
MIGMVAAAKRFWKETDVTETDDGWMIMLDGRAVKTPAGRPVALSSQRLAEAVGAEWKAQEENIIPATMPHFRYVVTAIDRVTPQRGDIINQLVGFSGNDLICYRDPDQLELASEQSMGWNPLLEWAESQHGIKLCIGAGVMPVKQDAETLLTAENWLSDKDDFRLAGLYNLISLSGSFVIGMAIEQGRLAVEPGFDLAFLDELWQTRKWGDDAEAEDRRQAIKKDMIEAKNYLSLLDQ